MSNRITEQPFCQLRVSCCFFLFDFQEFRKYFENIFEIVCKSKDKVVYLFYN